MKAKIKVLLVCDLEDWILRNIANHLSEQLSGSLEVTILITHGNNFLRDFKRIQSNTNLIQFLSPWDFFEYANKTYLPCVVTLWHMVDWHYFDESVPRIDSLFVGSHQWQQLVVPHIPNDLPCQIMQYGLDTKIFKHDHAAKERYLVAIKAQQETLIFGFAGSAWSNEGDRKGLDRIWLLLSKLKDRTDIKFILRIIGRGWSDDMIPEELSQFVKLDHFIDQSLLPEFYSSLDYYVCASRHEGVPYPVLEAMSCECTVISTPVGITPEIIQHGHNGFILSEKYLEKDFLEVIAQTADRPDFRKQCGANARITIDGRFSWERIIQPEKFVQLYTAAIAHYYSRSAAQRFKYYLRSFYEFYPHQLGINIYSSLITSYKKIKKLLPLSTP